ncbi:hypothetical protein AN217_01345 [Streptomyces qinglanensis]|uniref:DNA recombination-mediator protein A n=1 Tax=Streptomyces qinglanensis TaxID=943816 RepID=A0A1E7KDP2_9ACTN|nr:hypothetical protein [Streptomyces qinglanensis]MBE9498291.1 hypothetical protein [Streptomyces sp. GKU 257-1]OEV01964.1 hypothetical protein AN217_01345 [Streptomyces qinglanensis]OEV27393.1 hypothetical protein AN220_05100 [Streptomyces nanshensis]
MTTLAVTGHMDLTDEAVPLVRAALDRVLADYEPTDLVGVSCIAKGSDSLFAEAVLAAGGRLTVVLPSRDYREAKVKPEHAVAFDRLRAAASEEIVMPHETAHRTAYEAANAELLRRADRLVAVWDGQPPSGKGGGTADTVQQAQAVGLGVTVVWPEGAVRKG